MNKVTVIDGTGEEPNAPRPQRGLIKAVYDTIEACGGADFEQIRKYLPAAIEHINQVVTKKKIEKILYNAVYHGYLVHDNTGVTNKGYWKIAPLSYYNIRHAIIAEQKSKGVKRAKRGSYTRAIARRPLWHWQFISAVFGVGLMVGLSLGMYLS